MCHSHGRVDPARTLRVIRESFAPGSSRDDVDAQAGRIVTALAVWTFTDHRGAGRAERCLAAAAAQSGRTVADGTVVTWTPDRRRPRKRELEGIARTAVMADAFWGLLIGTVFFLPEMFTVGPSPQPLTDLLAGVGVDELVILRLRGEVVPGTSALLVFADDGVACWLDEVLAAAPPGSRAIGNRLHLLSQQQDEALRRVFVC